MKLTVGHVEFPDRNSLVRRQDTHKRRVGKSHPLSALTRTFHWLARLLSWVFLFVFQFTTQISSYLIVFYVCDQLFLVFFFLIFFSLSLSFPLLLHQATCSIMPSSLGQRYMSDYLTYFSIFPVLEYKIINVRILFLVFLRYENSDLQFSSDNCSHILSYMLQEGKSLSIVIVLGVFVLEKADLI